MIAEKNKRRNYFIKRKFQTKFILRFCGLVVLASAISGIIVFLHLYFRGTITTAFVNSRLSIITTADYILPVLIGASLITIVLISMATALVVMYLSHRIAGPLFRIEKSIDEIGAGNLVFKINLRSTDEIKKMADCINNMTENLKVNLLEIKARSKDLGNQIDNLMALSRNDTSLPQQIRDILEKLPKEKEELDKAIDYFKVENRK